MEKPKRTIWLGTLPMPFNLSFNRLSLKVMCNTHTIAWWSEKWKGRHCPSCIVDIPSLVIQLNDLVTSSGQILSWHWLTVWPPKSGLCFPSLWALTGKIKVLTWLPVSCATNPVRYRFMANISQVWQENILSVSLSPSVKSCTREAKILMIYRKT